jgi:ATP-dependent helicase/nuclease subunit B
LTALAGFPALQRDDFPTFLTALMAGEVVRPRAGLHARLSIWGPIEARLQQADLIVLGGLNEGSWPETQAPDPFLSRKMREALPLPQPEYRIGLDAHDFAAALGAPEVVLTRARRVEGAPSIPSRWLMRLEAVLKALKLELPLLAQGDPAALMRHLDLPDGPPRPAGQPHPAPPVAARPRQLSITDVEAWLANPYRLYARRILRLKPLDPLAPEPGAAEKGTLIHTILDRFLKAPSASEPLAALIDLGRAVFDEFKIPPALRLIWWPRFARIAAWFVEMQAGRAKEGIKNLASEAEGKLAFPAPGGTFQLTGKIDRVDRRPEGLEIIDYKTGTIPAKDDVESGARPQLPLSAAIVEGGGLKPIAGAVAQLAYWQISGGTIRGMEKIMTATPIEILNRLQNRVTLFDNPSVPYTARPPKPSARDYHAAYAHLARTAEWANDAEGEE